MAERISQSNIARLIAGDLSDAESRRLQDVLSADPALMKALVEQLYVDGMLCTLAYLDERVISRNLAKIRTAASPAPAPAARRRRSRTTRTKGPATRRSRIRPLGWLSAAACLALIVGTIVYNEHRSRTFPERFIAHVSATVPGVKVIRNGKGMTAVVNLRLRPGDRIETGNGQNVTFEYEDDGTTVKARPNTTLEMGPVDTGKRLRMEYGIIDAKVAPQPAGEEMTVATPHAKASVKGTVFSMMVNRKESRLEVTEGLVGLSKLSDGESVDVAGGQYAVAAEGVDLAVAALPDWRPPSPAQAPPAPAQPEGASPTVLSEADQPKPRTHLHGRTLFEDNFDGPPDNWDIVIGSPTTGFRTVTTGAQRFWAIGAGKVRPGGHFWPLKPPPPNPKGVEDISLITVNPGGPEPKETRDTKRFVGIRSRRAIEADRFVVEARISWQWAGQCWVPALEMIESQSQLLAVADKTPPYPEKEFAWYRWEFERTGGVPGRATFRCVHFLTRSRTEPMFREIARVTPTSGRLLFTYNNRDMCVDRIVARELKKDPADAGTE